VSVRAALLGVALALTGGAAHGQAIGPGKGETAATILGTRLEVHTYRPSCAPRLVFAVFHGLGRSAGPERDAVMPLAGKLCAVVVAPVFDAERFPTSQYQRGGVMQRGTFLPPGHRTVDMVAPLIEWARKEAGQANLPYALLGHSAGGQFLGRVAAYMAPDAIRIVIANPSTWVLPTVDVAAPYGFGKVPDGEQALRRYLALPVTVLLGQFDTGQENLSNEPEAMAQGENRLSRGRNAFTMAEAAARQHGWTLGWTKAEVPAVGHNAYKMFGSSEAAAAFK
jgi:hypothetical protein